MLEEKNPLETKPFVDLEEVKDRLRAATPGPWTWDGSRDGSYDGLWAAAGREHDDLVIVGEQGERVSVNVANADLIAHAPTDIANLIAEVARLSAAGQDQTKSNEIVDTLVFLERSLRATIEWRRQQAAANPTRSRDLPGNGIAGGVEVASAYAQVVQAILAYAEKA